MIGTKVTFTNGTTLVLKAVERAKYENMTHAARSLRKDMAASVMRAAKDEHAAVGDPPYTHRGNWYRRALWYHVDRNRQDALIGFRASKIGDVAAVHEHGGTEEGRQYPIRPTTLPALERNLGRFHRDWRASIG